MKIVQISAVVYPDVAPKSESVVYGLGEDNNIYFWLPNTKSWVLYEA